jgi:anti-anti-sigma factor
MCAEVAPAPLSVSTERSAEILRVELSGELSAATIKALERHIELLACCENRMVIVDLARLTYLDSTGARVLVGLGHYVRGGGGRCTLVGAARPMRELLAEASSAVGPALAALHRRPGLPGRPARTS